MIYIQQGKTGVTGRWIANQWVIHVPGQLSINASSIAVVHHEARGKP
jgi:hypothetical protein